MLASILVHTVCTECALSSLLSVSLPFPPPPPLPILLHLSLLFPSSSYPTVRNNCPHLSGLLEGLKPRSSEKCQHNQCCFPLRKGHTRHQVPYSSRALLVAVDTFHTLGLHPVPGLCDDLLSQEVQEYSPFERSVVLWTSS